MSSAPALLAVVGATGTGKTALSLDLATTLTELTDCPVEIVNADAMQVYRGMDIGTAKISLEQQRGIPHHLFDSLDPVEESTVAWYQPLARRTIREIHTRGHHAILIGGSGLYVSSVLFDFQFPPRDETLRAELEHVWNDAGIEPLIERLRNIDPLTAASVDVNNPRRVIRALEIAMLGGVAQVTLPESPPLWHANTRIFGAATEREQLVQRLDSRVEQMWADGLLAEVRDLIPKGIEHGKTASRAIGYAQALAQLNNECSESEAVAQTQLLTRRYARRQVSWFKRYHGVTWLSEAERPGGSYAELLIKN